MRKMTAIVSAIVLTTGAALAIEWGENTENLALGATVTASSDRGTEGENPANITDGNTGTRWQAVGGANTVSPDWVMLDLGEQKSFTDIEIMWEASHMKRYDVYVSVGEIPYSADESTGYNVIDAGWLETAVPVFADCGQDTESGCTDSLTEEDGVEGRYVLVYGKEYNGWAGNYGSSIFEIRIANIEGRHEIGSLTVSAAAPVAEGESATVTVGALTAGGSEAGIEEVEDLVLAADREGLEITAGENPGEFVVTGEESGDYTLTATGTAGGKTVSGSASFSVIYEWRKENIALGKAIAARYKAETGEDGETAADAPGYAAATDGDRDTYYEYNGQWGGGDAWVVVDLGVLCQIEEVAVAYGDNSGGSFIISFGGEDAGLPAAEDADRVWRTYGLAGWTDSGAIARKSNLVTPFEAPAGTMARYVCVHDNDNPNGKPRVAEIYVAGKEYTAPEATEVRVSASVNGLVSGETVTFEATVLDQYGAKMDVDPQEIVYSIDGASAEKEWTAGPKGVYALGASYGGIESETVELVVAAEGYEWFYPQVYTVRFGDEEIENPTVVGATDAVVRHEWTDDDIAARKALEIDLGGECTLDMITFSWEAACPKSYTVIIEDESGNSSEIAMKLDRGVEGNVTDRLYSHPGAGADRAPVQTAATLGKVRKITVIPEESNNSNGYTNKLFGISLYGSPAEGMITNVVGLVGNDRDETADVYSVSGMLLRRNVSLREALDGLGSGIYVVGGRKIVK
ncbi:MAG: discoidin domain-containing protein [Muribaculaceae bacterium]|nr:discoidin domain-containing protein [Muribaculaceae bacterium]